ncbi:unnamed protein product [Angiostrongylus costaricensis]|uniref:Histone domain-containing protein n=1 Tax=Angiostrongylus costaricensis TaxID=334426 RepID=A0A0R3PIH7_ANGCS|nr:unnamed protein product [Angiostrongylus costaricensis]
MNTKFVVSSTFLIMVVLIFYRQSVATVGNWVEANTDLEESASNYESFTKLSQVTVNYSLKKVAPSGLSSSDYPVNIRLVTPPNPSAKGAKKAAKSQKASRAGDKKKKHRRKESYSVYIYRVLKQVHPDTGGDFVEGDVHHELICERRASRLAHYNKRSTISSREIQTAVRLIRLGELAQHAVSEGTKAVNKFTSSK